MMYRLGMMGEGRGQNLPPEPAIRPSPVLAVVKGYGSSLRCPSN